MKPIRVTTILLMMFVGVSVLAVDLFSNAMSPSLQVVGTNVVLSASFLTVPGRQYQVEVLYSDSLAMPSNGWFNAGDRILGNGGTVTWSYTDVGAASITQRYYWFRLELFF